MPEDLQPTSQEEIPKPSSLEPLAPAEAPRQLRFKNSVRDWAIRALIFVAFLFFGTGKFKTDSNAPWVLLFDRIGWGSWFRYLTGSLEIAGAFLVLISQTVELGIALLIATMFGAMLVVALVLHRPQDAFFPFAFLSGMIAFWMHRRRV